MNAQKYFLPLLLLLAISACKPRETLVPAPPQKESSEIPGYDTDLISLETDQVAWDVLARITRLDTAYEGVSLAFGWFAFVADNDSLIVSIDTDSSVSYGLEFIKTWNERYKKWLVYNGAVVNTLNSPGEGQVTMKLKNKLTGKEHIRKKTYTIRQQKVIYDVFRVRFGMSAREVKSEETARLSIFFSPNSGWTEVLNDSLYYANYVNNKNYLSPLTVPYSPFPATYYEFSKGKLVAVSEIVHPEAQDIRNKEQFDSLRKTFQKLGTEKLPFEHEPPYRYTGEPLSWTNNGLKMTFEKRPFKLAAGKDIETYALTVRPAEN